MSNILETLHAKEKEIGLDELSKRLNYPKGLLSQHLRGTRKFGAKLSQSVVQTFGVASVPSPNGDAVGEIVPASREVLPEKTPEVQEAPAPQAAAENDGDGVSLSYAPEKEVKVKWAGRDVCLCIPSYKDVPGEFFFSVMAMAMRYKESIRLEHRGNDAMVARSRNQLAKRFLKTEASWSIWLDDDMIFPFGHAGVYATMTGMRNVAEKFLGLHTIERLISWDRSIVGGCYWDRLGTNRLIAGGSVPITSPIPSDNLQPVSFVGTGCLAVHRQVFLDIAQKFPETMNDEAYGNETGFFTPIQDEKRMKGEDEAFAWRANEAGHPSYLDLGLICGHVGRKVYGMPESGSKI